MPLIPSIHLLITFDGHKLLQSFSQRWAAFKRSLSLDGQVIKTEVALEHALDAVREQLLEGVVDEAEIAELLTELAKLGEKTARKAKGHSTHNPVRIAQVAHARHDVREVDRGIRLAGAVQKIRQSVEECRTEAKYLVSELPHVDWDVKK